MFQDHWREAHGGEGVGDRQRIRDETQQARHSQSRIFQQQNRGIPPEDLLRHPWPRDSGWAGNPSSSWSHQKKDSCPLTSIASTGAPYSSCFETTPAKNTPTNSVNRSHRQYQTAILFSIWPHITANGKPERNMRKKIITRRDKLVCKKWKLRFLRSNCDWLITAHKSRRWIEIWSTSIVQSLGL